MRKTAWKPAIVVEDPQSGTRTTVRTVRQAFKTLHDHWPDTSGSRYRLADHVCDEVLHGHLEPAEARKAFIAAAIEAHLHLG
ncbi:DUF982 domain-containing protein [Rhizobium alvei]|uniref:DUF982 domain-containing protein n=1 Tax=Rhizobium alvei TaxID=1132659 RepID=A0ABT8YMR1_9HYPH|nr:DUF982 domain-containing protein [Rhizobium alvei]MDO6965010.1 DUF982 domain-containing protein [Rhizobium alvei]